MTDDQPDAEALHLEDLGACQSIEGGSMGVDYSVDLAIGVVVTRAELERVFSVPYPEESRLEDRYDPKTGEKLEAVLVVTQPAGTDLFFEGEEFSLFDDTLCEAIANTVRCTYCVAINAYDDGVEYAIFGPHLRPEPGQSAYSQGHLSVSPGHLLRDVATAVAETDVIADKLRSYGLEVGEAVVRPVLSVY